MFLAILSICLGRNDRLFILVSAGVLAVPGAFPAQQTGGLGQCGPEQNLPCRACSWGRRRLEFLPGVLRRGSRLLSPVNYCPHWEPRSRESDEWESCQSSAERLGPPGASEVHPLAFFLFEKLTVITVEMSGRNLEKVVLFFSPYIYISQYDTGQFDLSRLTKPCLSFFPRKRRNFNWKLNSKVFRNRNPYLQGTSESLLSGIIVCFNKLVGHLIKWLAICWSRKIASKKEQVCDLYAGRNMAS